MRIIYIFLKEYHKCSDLIMQLIITSSIAAIINKHRIFPIRKLLTDFCLKTQPVNVKIILLDVILVLQF